MDRHAKKIKDQTILAAVKKWLPDVQALWLFGSRANGRQRPDSDLDLAVLLPEPLDPLVCWDVAQPLACLFDVDVDLIDIRTTSTVLQHQIIAEGRRLWANSPLTADLYELFILNSYTALNEARAPLLSDFLHTEKWHAR